MRTSDVELPRPVRSPEELLSGGPSWARVAELHWPTLLVVAACCGLALANWVSPGTVVVAGLALAGLIGVTALEGLPRALALGLALAALGLWWGALRMEALERSVLGEEIGASGPVRVVVTGAARVSPWAIRVPAEVRAFRERPVRERVLLTLPVGRSPPRGAILETTVRVAEPRPARNGFDERAWLARQGIHVVLRGGAWAQVGRRGGLAGVGDRLRDSVEAAAERGTSGVRRGIVLGVVLGEDEGLPRPVQDAFRASGLYHLLAVSGQNVAFIAIGVFGLGWLLRLPRAVREVLILAAIGAYVLAVGWQPSVVRAGVAGALASLAWLVARPRDRWHFLAVGALVLLAWAPTSLLEPGFQLSFAAVAAIFVGLPRIARIAEGYPVPRGIAELVGVAFVCGLATAPIVLLHFDRAPVYTVPANALAAPAMPLTLGLGLLAGAVEPFSPAAAGALAWLGGWAAAWLELVAALVAALPGAQVGTRSALAVAVVATGAWVVLRAVRSGVAAVPGATALVLGGAVVVAGAGWWSLRPAPTWEPPAGLRVTFLDVGQGDAVLLETASARVLVDQGPPEADVAGQLLRMGVRSLSALVLTHPERDHVGGAADVIRRLAVGTVLDPELAARGPEYDEAVTAARERGVRRELIRAGSELRVGGLRLRVLWPRDEGLPAENPNLNATVLVASYGETDVFLPADAESEVTRRLRVGDVEVLKVAHHGSEDPGLDAQLRTLRPELAVISVGRANGYGHPRPQVLAALARVSGLEVFRTDLHGRVVIESDGRLLRARTGR